VAGIYETLGQPQTGMPSIGYRSDLKWALDSIGPIQAAKPNFERSRFESGEQICFLL